MKRIPNRFKFDPEYQPNDVLLKMVREEAGEPENMKNPTIEDRGAWNQACNDVASTFKEETKTFDTILNYKFD